MSVSFIATLLKVFACHGVTRVLQTSPCLPLVVFGLAKNPRRQIVKVIKFCVRKEKGDNEGVIQSHVSLFSDADASNANS